MKAPTHKTEEMNACVTVACVSQLTRTSNLREHHKMKKPARLMLDIAQWRLETISLSAAESGALLFLKMYYWQMGSIPDRDQSIAQIVRMELKDWKKARRALEPLFIIGDGEWFRTDWNEELEAAYVAIKKAREAGQHANKVRWGNSKRRNNVSSFESDSDPSCFLNNKGTPPSQELKSFTAPGVEIEQAVSVLESAWKGAANG